ncbi:MAG: hypothetical protein GY743_10860 [Planctomycetaceae bacterium]|nr:hypothetical protein [Planctomycetaceae bacterium]
MPQRLEQRILKPKEKWALVALTGAGCDLCQGPRDTPGGMQFIQPERFPQGKETQDEAKNENAGKTQRRNYDSHSIDSSFLHVSIVGKTNPQWLLHYPTKIAR